MVVIGQSSGGEDFHHCKKPISNSLPHSTGSNTGISNKFKKNVETNQVFHQGGDDGWRVFG